MATAAPITGAPTRAPSIHRRSFFGSLAVLPAIAAAPSLAALPTLTPFRVAEIRYRAATAHFLALPRDLEATSPALFEREVGTFIAAARAVDMAPASTAQEFVEGFLICCDDGDSSFTETVMGKLVADAKRLMGAA